MIRKDYFVIIRRVEHLVMKSSDAHPPAINSLSKLVGRLWSQILVNRRFGYLNCHVSGDLDDPGQIREGPPLLNLFLCQHLSYSKCCPVQHTLIDHSRLREHTPLPKTRENIHVVPLTRVNCFTVSFKGREGGAGSKDAPTLSPVIYLLSGAFSLRSGIRTRENDRAIYM